MNENSGLSLSRQPLDGYPCKTRIKGFITGCLILLVLIPTVFVSNLVGKLQARQQEVKNEVSTKWAVNQSLFPWRIRPCLWAGIGLFVILTLAMHASRKIHWYGRSFTESVIV